MTRLATVPALSAPILCLALAVATAQAAPPASHELTSRTLVELGIPTSYGVDRGLPGCPEATDLVPVGLDGTGRTQRLQPRAAAAWRGMQQAAREDGVTLLLVSAFRSVDQQRQIFERKLRAGQTLQDILAVNVPPGFSQHHTGTAVDLGTPGSTALLEDFEHTAAFGWLRAHASDHGFSLSYPRGNAAGMAYEPWHWAFSRGGQAACFTDVSRGFHARLHGFPAHSASTESR